VEHDKVTKPRTTHLRQHQKLEIKKRKIYVPGFGWIEDNGGGGSGTTAEDNVQNGNKIGSM
jgi:beta-galactosidase/beta-glucuronidase